MPAKSKIAESIHEVKMDENTFDFGIIGAGPGGYTAAIRAAQLGKSVVLFEKEFLGGTCLNKGCIPTKTFLHTADIYNSLKKAASLGINIESASIDFAQVAEKKDKIVEKIRKSLEMLLKSYGIEIVMAEAKISGENTVEAQNTTYNCKTILTATGAEAKSVGGLEFDGKFILNSNDVLELKTLPKKVLIVGSGAIGIEWARIFSAFGTEVTVIEIAPALLPIADFEISQRIERIFKMAKVKTCTSTSIKEIRDKTVELSNGITLEPDFILLATGRKPITTDPAGILIGDAAKGIQLAHFASHQGLSVVEKIISGREIEPFITPSIVYGAPEIAWIGKTEQELQKEGLEYKKSNFPIPALGKAQCEGNVEGFVKMLASPDDKILGAHIISKEASALIHQISIAMENNLTVKALTHCCFAHPTYSEGVYESLLALDGLSLSLPRGKDA